MHRPVDDDVVDGAGTFVADADVPLPRKGRRDAAAAHPKLGDRPSLKLSLYSGAELRGSP
jgi:hypothetical protein